MLTLYAKILWYMKVIQEAFFGKIQSPVFATIITITIMLQLVN